MKQVSQKHLVIIIGVFKVVFFLIIFNRQDVSSFFIALLVLVVILIAEIIAIINKKYKRTFIVVTIVLFLGILPIMNLGNKYGPTFGNKIKFNNFLWKYSFNDNIRYYMADDIIKIIIENGYSKNDIIKMLGKPDFGDCTFFLKSNSLLGFDMYLLSIYFVDDKYSSAEIIRID